jgi:hypothetical protein
MSAVVRKDTSIWSVIAHLATNFGGDNFQLVDHWDADLFSVGIASVNDQRRLVYLSTFEKEPGRLAYECESADGGVGERSESTDLPTLLQVVERHLLVAPRGRA